MLYRALMDARSPRPRGFGAPSKLDAEEGGDGNCDVLHAMSVEDALSRIGTGCFQRRVWFLCGLGVAGDGMEKAATMYVVQGAIKQWGVRGEAVGLLGSASGLGQMLGAFFFGLFSDAYGRRLGLLLALGTSFVFGVLSALAPDYWAFVALRLMTNIGLGGALPVAFTLLAEVLPPENRAQWTPLLYATYGVGRLLTAIVAWCLLEFNFRLYMLAIAVPSVILLLLQSYLPETPEFLFKRGRVTEANAALRAIAVCNEADVLQILEEQSLDEKSACARTRCSSLCLFPVFMLCIMWLLVALGNEWTNWILVILLQCGVPSFQVYAGLAFFNANELVVPLLVTMATSDMVSRNLGALLKCVCFIAIAPLAALACSVATLVPHWILLGLSALAAYACIAVWVVHYTITPIYFPTEVRSTGFGVCMTFNRAGYFIGPLVAASVVGTKPAFLLGGCAACYVALTMLALLLGRPPDGTATAHTPLTPWSDRARNED
mmetsp:Transcript_32983/g.90971  ORF Transcript_32983/g.90971 Transcript_32983/m.90971 type:complete len:491 (+) Transcript_32983:97-1569(+)